MAVNQRDDHLRLLNAAVAFLEAERSAGRARLGVNGSLLGAALAMGDPPYRRKVHGRLAALLPSLPGSEVVVVPAGHETVFGLRPWGLSEESVTSVIEAVAAAIEEVFGSAAVETEKGRKAKKRKAKKPTTEGPGNGKGRRRRGGGGLGHSIVDPVRDASIGLSSDQRERLYFEQGEGGYPTNGWI